MDLSRSEFSVLIALMDESICTQRLLAEATDLSLGTVNTLYRKLSSQKLVDDFSVTPQGYRVLVPYKVENAVIMAAGLSSRFAPLSYEKPKGVLNVRGEVLIERQIRQLQEVGIDDIVVVVGYMKEAFFYLEDLFNVTIQVNEEYATRNNHSSLMVTSERLGNTYICSSDDYFTENVFEPYVYESYYAGVYFEGETDEYCMSTSRDGRIVRVSVGGSDAFGMLGQVYFDRVFSRKFVEILKAEYSHSGTAGKLWEDIYIDHIKELRMILRPYAEGVVYEFDSLADLKQFDQDFIMNVDSEILDNICKVLQCDRSSVEDIDPIKEGLTNLSFKFSVDGQEYVYRHPGPGTDKIINRESEAYSQGIAKKLGIDETFIYQDLNKGWKLSHYIEGCVPFDYHDMNQVRQAMSLVRRLHNSGETSQWNFDMFAKAQDIMVLLGARDYPSFPDYGLLHDRVELLDTWVKTDQVPLCLCHNDFYNTNFLVSDNSMFLIDWEYSAMSDYAADLGTFICCSDYSIEEAKQVLEVYFGRPLNGAELRHCIAYVALSAYQWFVWALYKESTGDPVGEWLYLWYRYAKTYSKVALKMYNQK